MNQIQYEAIFRIDLGKAIPAVGELCKSVNDTMASSGIKDKLMITAEPFSCVLTVDRELNEQEQHTVKTVMESEVIKVLHQYDIKLVSFRRKSGNASQSAE